MKTSNKLDLTKTKTFLTSLFDRFQSDNTTTLAASLSYFTALSLAPLVVLFVVISSKLDGHIEEVFLKQMQSLVGPNASQIFEMVIQNAKERPDLTSISGVIGVITLLFSASLIFGELRTALNKIFENPEETTEPPATTFLRDVFSFIRERFLRVGIVLSFLFIMIVSLMASSFISATIEVDRAIWGTMNAAVSLLFFIGLFSLLFRYLPNSRIKWGQALKGGFITALLFVIGKELIGFYLGNSSIGSAYGAAGSIIVLLVWVYYSALITFIGAHVSSLLTHSHS